LRSKLTFQTFKFLTNKPANSFAGSPQWLHILKAEEEGLITISINVADAQVDAFSGALERCCVSTDYGEIASSWDELRKEVCRDVVKNHLIPMGSKWVKEYLKGQAEDYVAEHCRRELEFVSVKPAMGCEGTADGHRESTSSHTADPVWNLAIPPPSSRSRTAKAISGTP
jgi:transcription elongation factor SPT6